ncbi:MAG: hypothetical protein U0836_13605 [Pirellulales bacterium]
MPRRPVRIAAVFIVGLTNTLMIGLSSDDGRRYLLAGLASIVLTMLVTFGAVWLAGGCDWQRKRT